MMKNTINQMGDWTMEILNEDITCAAKYHDWWMKILKDLGVLYRYT